MNIVLQYKLKFFTLLRALNLIFVAIRASIGHLCRPVLQLLPPFELLDDLLGESLTSYSFVCDLEDIRWHVGVIVEGLEVQPADEEAQEHDIGVVSCEDNDQGEWHHEGVDASRVVDVHWSCLEAEGDNE